MKEIRKNDNTSLHDTCYCTMKFPVFFFFFQFQIINEALITINIIYHNFNLKMVLYYHYLHR